MPFSPCRCSFLIIKSGCVIIGIFAKKNRHNPLDKDSLSLFLKKLGGKRQSEQQKQAQHTITIFYQIKITSAESNANTDESLRSSSWRIQI